LDNLSRGELEGKPVGLLSHSGGFPPTQALDHLRAVVRGLLGVAIPRQVVTVDGDYTLSGERYVLSSAGTADRLVALADELLWFTARLRAESLDADELPALAHAR